MIRATSFPIAIALTMAVSAFAPSWGWAQTIKPIVIGEAKPAPTGTAPVGSVSSALSRPEGGLNCSIQPSRIVEVASPIDGVLAEVFVRPGQTVAKGDVIARLDTDIAAAELAAAAARAASTGALQTAEARVGAAAVQYRTQKKAYEGRVAPRIDFERARGDLSVAQKEVQREKEALAIARTDQERMELIVAKGAIRAPFDGVIGEDLLNPSEAIEGRPVAQLIVIDPMRVEVFATVDAATAIRAGGDYVVVSNLNDPLIADVTLDYISPIADSSSQTIRVYYHLSSTEIAPGYRCYLATRSAAEEFRAAVRGEASRKEPTQ